MDIEEVGSVLSSLQVTNSRDSPPGGNAVIDYQIRMMIIIDDEESLMMMDVEL